MMDLLMGDLMTMRERKISAHSKIHLHLEVYGKEIVGFISSCSV